MILIGTAVALMFAQTQDVPATNTTGVSSTDPLIGAIDSVVSDPEFGAKIAKAKADEDAHLKALRQARATAPATNGRERIARSKEERADAALLALSDLDELLIGAGRHTATPFANNVNTSGGPSIHATWVAQHSWICSDALWIDDPLKALAVEAQRQMMDGDQRYALMIMCKIYWAGFVRGAQAL